jgi:hypothetical protein
MKGYYIHSEYGEGSLVSMFRNRLIGRTDNVWPNQIDGFEKTPLVFCSYLCKGYPDRYGQLSKSPAIAFATRDPIAYASPTDTVNYLRNGRFMKGYKKFIFPSLSQMLENFPSVRDFKKAFIEFFMTQNPYSLYDNLDERTAKRLFESDDCLREHWNPGCNEIAFRKPLRIKPIKIIKKGEKFS